MASAARRRDMDMMKLMMSDYDVQAEDDGKYEFVVNFHGPSETPYEGGTWQVAVALPAQYPFKSPSISFRNRMFHPNVDERSGSVCLDVINQTWSPMFDLVNVFDVFLPQLLRYPNPTDPLNGEAAALLLREPETYAARIKEYVVRYAGGAKTSAAAAKAKAAAAEAASAAAAAASASSSSSSTTSNRSRSESASSAVSTSVDDSMSKDDSDSADGGVSEADDDEEDDDDMSVVSDISELSDM